MKCSKCKNEAVEGIKVCQSCREKSSLVGKRYSIKHKDRVSAAKKLYHAANRELINTKNKVWRHSGVCVDCGGIPVDGLVRCQPCREVANARAKARRLKCPDKKIKHDPDKAKKIYDMKRANNQCTNCNDTALPGKSLCAICRGKRSIQDKEYRKKNLAKITAYQKEYTTKNADRLSQWGKTNRVVNKEKISQYRRNKHAANPSISRNQSFNYHCRKRTGMSEKIDRQKVFNRDNHTCQICGGAVDHDAIKTHPLYPTIDHIIPLSKGGVHTYFNVQCAHFGCNATKGAKYPISDPATIKLMVEFNRVFLGGDH